MINIDSHIHLGGNVGDKLKRLQGDLLLLSDVEVGVALAELMSAQAQRFWSASWPSYLSSMMWCWAAPADSPELEYPNNPWGLAWETLTVLRAVRVRLGGGWVATMGEDEEICLLSPAEWQARRGLP